jgi:hypothetical protein
MIELTPFNFFIRQYKMEHHFYVYTHALPNTNDIYGIFYVGKGNEKRVKVVGRNHNKYHMRIVKKYGGARNIIVRKILCKSENDAFDLKIKIISKLKQLGANLTNFTDGGEGASGYLHSDENKQKMSQKAKERASREDWKSKASENAKRYFSNPENRKKQSDRVKKQLSSPEAKAAHSARLKKALSNPETKLKMSRSAIDRFKRPEEKIAKSKERKAYYENNPEARLKAAEKTRIQFSTPESRENKSKERKEYYKNNPEAREKAAQKQREYAKNNPLKMVHHSVKLATIWAEKSGRQFSYIPDKDN